MPRALRISLVLAAVIAAVVAFAVLRPEDEPAVSEPAPQAAQTPTPGGEEEAATPTPTPTPTPRPPLLTAGSVEQLSVRRGETVAFRVRHPSDEEVHIHGYDIARPLPAGRTVTVSFKARIEGIFEIELERSHVQIASLQVEP
ncbi:MAG: hypothetical protein AVDCRST_MAG38-2161 [uncultured Solirubrobacteraceae bacterium]|uniref:EfeO-type cupredoxin-like domain-containing protein n=1 Tax=uncultured Solirubrobacteraceae bacterium TaxID=1162706 RepID=A0A6J4RW99_9ACTN|nr:MAG: hypothetical protein AVDCRST_MAG38-2161 [uncultured Solirubrobacteraceae bacterium]